MREFIYNSSNEYFKNLMSFIKSQFHSLNEVVEKCKQGRIGANGFQDTISEQLDHLYYLNDIFALKIKELQNILKEILMKYLIQPFLIQECINNVCFNVYFS